jgi:hypothetical protein
VTASTSLLTFLGGFTSRAHDARVLANSTLFHWAEQGVLLPQRVRRIGGNDINPVIIGDPALAYEALCA